MKTYILTGGSTLTWNQREWRTSIFKDGDDVRAFRKFWGIEADSFIELDKKEVPQGPPIHSYYHELAHQMAEYQKVK